MADGPIGSGELSNIIEDKIMPKLAVLCAQLERGERSDQARSDFQDALASAIAEVIVQAVSRGVKTY